MMLIFCKKPTNIHIYYLKITKNMQKQSMNMLVCILYNIINIKQYFGLTNRNIMLCVYFHQNYQKNRKCSKNIIFRYRNIKINNNDDFKIRRINIFIHSHNISRCLLQNIPKYAK